MPEAAIESQIEAVAAYEELLLPALFEQWAAPTLDAAKVRPGSRVLDVACGTGILAREALVRAGPAASIAGVDVNLGILEIARCNAPDVDWRQAAAEQLPFEDGSFDAVVSQFGLMFFQDRTTSIREMLRVSVAGGRIAIAVWDGLENNRAYLDEVTFVERAAGKAAGDALRAPFAFGDQTELKEILADSGLAVPELRSREGLAEFPDFRTLVEADLRGWLPVMGVELDEDMIQAILAEAEPTLAHHSKIEGRAVFPVSIHIVSATKQ